MEKKLIFLSPSSHGKGANRGIEEGCYEDGHTRPIAEETKKQLESTGRFEVVIAKPGTSMAERCAESNRLGADLHVPIHTNASSNKNVRYLMFMFYADTKEYRKLFDAVRKPLEAVHPGPSEAVFDVRRDLYEINQPKAITLYCELGFHTNVTDSEFIHDEETVGKALAEGICDYYDVKLNAKKEEAPKKETPKKEAPKKDEKAVEEDGLWGRSTTKHTQTFLGTPVDGIVSNQLHSCKEFLMNMLEDSWEFEHAANGGSAMIKKLQTMLKKKGFYEGKIDGYAGELTIKALQSFLAKQGLYKGKIDGYAGELTVTAWQKYLNKNL